VGRPGNTALVDGITTSQYSIELPTDAGVPFIFNSVVDNNTMVFEAINAAVSTDGVSEYGAAANAVFNLLYRDDQRGYGSNNTGFFLYFKQGTLLSERFSITESLPNRAFNLGSTGINNNDVWLYKVNSDGTLTEWTRVDSANGYNNSYNSVSSTNKKVFSVHSQANDGATLLFGDGIFSEIPVGDFVCYYRISNGLNYRINPGEMNNVIINIPYISKNSRVQTLSLTASLKYTVANSSSRESIDDIKIRAPQNFYTQNRMVNGQDYNSFPFAKYSNILKIKSVNRMSSGISRYLDVIDTTGRYSSTNIVCDDGYLYKDSSDLQSQFTFSNRDDIVESVNNIVLPAIADPSLQSFFYKNFTPFSPVSENGVVWNLVLADNDVSSGYLSDGESTVDDLSTTGVNEANLLTTNDTTAFDYKFRVGSVLKFMPPTTPVAKWFNYDNQLVDANGAAGLNQKSEIYATVRSISQFGRGTQIGNDLTTIGRDTTGVGAIVISEKIPTGAYLSLVMPSYDSNLPSDLQKTLIDALAAQKNIGLGYKTGNSNTDAVGEWFIIENPLVNGTFVEPTTTASTNTNSWLIAFTNTANTYTVTQRSIKYYFGSERQTRFFYDPQVKIYDPISGKLLKDRIDVLKVNNRPQEVVLAFNNDIPMSVAGVVIEGDGFVDDTKIQATFADKDSDGSPDQPYFFDDIVGDTETMPGGVENTYVFFVNDQDVTGSSMRALAPGVVKIIDNDADIDGNLYNYSNNDIVFARDTELFYKISRNVDSISKSQVTNYAYRYGRMSIKFQYRHNAPSDRRIDPSPSNIIDIYILEKNYADDYSSWIKDQSGIVTEPTEPTTESLRNDFSELEQYRMISDLIIFNPVKFKPLFGSKADSNLRSKFVVVKNSNVLISDSEVKSKVITKINEYFAVDNWDFGETFYFSELAAYLHAELNDIISSVSLVPTSTDQVYGDLQQIRCLPYEILISAATVLDVDVVTNLTTTKLRVGN
jgi:hypothetical protein